MPKLATATSTIKIDVPEEKMPAFLDWQSRLRSQLSVAEGFVSVEFISLQPNRLCTIHQRFDCKDHLERWLHSSVYRDLILELSTQHIIKNPLAIREECSDPMDGVTEIFFSLVSKENATAFRQWLAKIHAAEAQFPGFQKVYVQAPETTEKESVWITLLQFDTAINLENWLSSSVRAEILKEAQNFVTSLETHRVLSSFGGWFASTPLSNPAARWKENMLVLLVLFPSVMLLRQYPIPYFNLLNPSLKMFLENAISVSLIGWITLPIAIYLLRWWLGARTILPNFLGFLIVIFLYVLAIYVFWS